MTLASVLVFTLATIARILCFSLWIVGALAAVVFAINSFLSFVCCLLIAPAIALVISGLVVIPIAIAVISFVIFIICMGLCALCAYYSSVLYELSDRLKERPSLVLA